MKIRMICTVFLHYCFFLEVFDKNQKSNCWTLFEQEKKYAYDSTNDRFKKGEILSGKILEIEKKLLVITPT